jgi:hypothetical protein
MLTIDPELDQPKWQPFLCLRMPEFLGIEESPILWYTTSPVLQTWAREDVMASNCQNASALYLSFIPDPVFSNSQLDCGILTANRFCWRRTRMLRSPLGPTLLNQHLHLVPGHEWPFPSDSL